MEHNFFEPELNFESTGDISFHQTWKSIAAPTSVSNNEDGCFDCNICLDSAHEPVVTLCGHLYCWPCIYKWIHVPISADDPDPQRKCPVCKANISQTSMVPLYGRGGTAPPDSTGKKPNSDLVIPQRPVPSGLNTLTSDTNSTLDSSQQLHPNYFQSQSFHQQQYFLGDEAMAGLFSPTIGMFGEMVYARMFGSSNTSVYPYGYPGSYPLTGISSTRMRRQEMQLGKSLNRLSIFIFCFIILCFLLF